MVEVAAVVAIEVEVAVAAHMAVLNSHMMITISDLWIKPIGKLQTFHTALPKCRSLQGIAIEFTPRENIPNKLMFT